MRSPRNQAPFRPKRHDKFGVKHPFSAKQRHILPPEELERLHEKNVERDERFRRFGTRTRERTKAYLIGAPLGMLIWNVMFTQIGFTALYFQLPLYALWAVYLAWMRPVGIHAVLITVATGFLTVQLTGVYIYPIFIPVTLLFWMILGWLVAFDEESKLGLGDR